MKPKMLTTTEAATLSRVSRKTLLSAINHGTLKATDTGAAPTAGRHRYLINLTDLKKFLKQYRPVEDRRPWTEADIAALVELQDTCSGPQLAEYLGRSYGTVHTKIHRLKKDGGLDREDKRGRKFVPFIMPANSILVARTCTDCGKIRDARYFQRRGGGQPVHGGACRVCIREEERRTNRALLARNIKQKITVDRATRSGYEYTQSEIEVVSDSTKSNLEVALELKRTYSGVSNMRGKLGIHTSPARVGDSHWMIHFPAAMTELREHFRSIGEPVPEELWDWNDKENAA